jgi:L-ascorbate oxidase
MVDMGHGTPAEAAAASGGHGGHAGHGMPEGEQSGLTHTAAEGGRVLKYSDIKALRPAPQRPADQEITLRLTGSMERYFWGFDDKKHSEAGPIRVRHGDRIRFTFVNETMMNHPMHLHGLWMHLDNGVGALKPLKHVVNVPPGQTVSVEVEAETVGRWAFHCHLMFHMATGMFRELVVEPATPVMEGHS